MTGMGTVVNLVELRKLRFRDAKRLLKATQEQTGSEALCRQIHHPFPQGTALSPRPCPVDCDSVPGWAPPPGAGVRFGSAGDRPPRALNFSKLKAASSVS